jgi:hypothetical protein
MGWWWDGYVEPRGLWTHCLGLSRFVRGERLAGLVPAPAATDAAEAAPALALAARDRAWAWVRNAREVRMLRETLSVRVGTYRVDAAPAARRLTIAAAFPGTWLVDFIDPYDGTWLSSSMANGDATGIEIPLPAYRHDLALKLRRLDRPGPLPAGPPAPTPWHDEVERVMEGR